MTALLSREIFNHLASDGDTNADAVQRHAAHESHGSPWSVQGLGALASRSLWLEVHTWPKPGLVSHVDAGSHDDMDADTFERSALALQPFFTELAQAGADNAPMSTLRKIGLRAETAMFAATGGINTHRGAIFGMGLLCAAAGLRATRNDASSGDVSRLGDIVRARWGSEILGGPRLPGSHGEAVVRRYGVGGARAEAASGFPSVYEIGLPALRQALAGAHECSAHECGSHECGSHDWVGARINNNAARVHACLALVSQVQDTNVLHRGGAAGLQYAQARARRFMATGGVLKAGWQARAQRMHQSFVQRRLSPGGAADLLAMTLFAHATGD
ncbi:2-(5''-triphosphoribosyl)-3'-dephosphocoenzyme-A synthase [compost metagenome]